MPQVMRLRPGRDFLENAISVRLLFQLTDSEIATARQPHLPLPEAELFNRGLLQSFFFVAVELNGRHYARGRYAQFVREINKWSQSPTVVLFKTAADRLTLAFVHRRQHKRNPDRDVLGRVSLVREIDPKQPHQAHIRILEELSLVDRLKWMDAHHKPHNFDGLLAAWLDALDTEELNRRFYKELFAWFERAVTVARFPNHRIAKVPGPRGTHHPAHHPHAVRLVHQGKELDCRRTIQRGASPRPAPRLQPGQAAIPTTAPCCRTSSLPHLTPRSTGAVSARQTNDTHRDFSRYRYEDEMSDPERLLALFRQTPFHQRRAVRLPGQRGGRSKTGGYRIDCFTDNVTNHARNTEYFDP